MPPPVKLSVPVYTYFHIMMQISTFNRNKISILNSVAIMLVLLLHSYYLEAVNYPLAQSIQLFTGTIGLSGVAVPLFYFMSGLLFFKSVESIKDCFPGIRKSDSSGLNVPPISLSNVPGISE